MGSDIRTSFYVTCLSILWLLQHWSSGKPDLLYKGAPNLLQLFRVSCAKPVSLLSRASHVKKTRPVHRVNTYRTLKGNMSSCIQMQQKKECEPTSRDLVIGPELKWTWTTSVLTAKGPVLISDTFSTEKPALFRLLSKWAESYRSQDGFLSFKK